MSYQVVKTVKGKQYLYEQESYRVGDKVRTRSHYIGPVDGLQRLVGVRTASVVGEAPPKEQKADTGQNKAKSDSKPVITTDSKDPFKEKAVFSSRVDLSKHRISGASLEVHAQKFRDVMLSKSIDTRKLASIEVRYGKKILHRKSKKRNAYIVTLPKKKINRSDFRRECQKAMARSGLEQMEQHHPKIYAKFSNQFEQSFKNTQQHLSRYVMSGNDRKRFYKVIGLKYWGRSENIKNHYCPVKFFQV